MIIVLRFGEDMPNFQKVTPEKGVERSFFGMSDTSLVTVTPFTTEEEADAFIGASREKALAEMNA